MGLYHKNQEKLLAHYGKPLLKTGLINNNWDKKLF